MKTSRILPLLAVLGLLLSASAAEGFSGAHHQHASQRGGHFAGFQPGGWYPHDWSGYLYGQDAIALRYIAGYNQLAGSQIASRQAAAKQLRHHFSPVVTALKRNLLDETAFDQLASIPGRFMITM